MYVKSFNMFLTLWQLCEVRLFYFSFSCKFDVNSALRKNSEQSLSSIVPTEASFGWWYNEETLNINKVKFVGNNRL